MVTGMRKRRPQHPVTPPLQTGNSNRNEATPPPLPPKDPPPVPPRTYPRPRFIREPLGPPLPPRNYLENEEAQALQRPTEEQNSVHRLRVGTSLSQEEQDMQPVDIPNVNPPTTVLLPRATKHAQASSSSLDLDTSRKTRDGCSSCESLKGVIKQLMNFKTPCKSCKKTMQAIRRHSK